MAQPAAHLALLAAVDPITVAVDAYLDATIERYTSTLTAALATLREPSTSRPDRAMRFVGFAVETLAGFARGAALDPLAQLLRRHADAAGRAALAKLLATGIAATSPAASGMPVLVRMLADAERRPLVDDFGARLHLRIVHDLADLRAIARRLAAAAPGALADQIAALGADDTAALRFGDQLGLGWVTVGAAIDAHAAPRIEHARSRDLWHGWLRYVRGQRAARAVEWRVGDRQLTEGLMQIG